MELGRDRMLERMKKGPLCDLLFVADDHLALGVIPALLEGGVRIPEDLKFVTHYNKGFGLVMAEATAVVPEGRCVPIPAGLSDDQALALVRSYGSLGPGAGKLKYMIQQYFGDRDEDFQETLYNSVRDERDWSHNWRTTKPVKP